jgi:hypothetical protein
MAVVIVGLRGSSVGSASGSVNEPLVRGTNPVTMWAMRKGSAKPTGRWIRWAALASLPLLATLGLWIGWTAHQVRLREQVVERIELEGGSVVWLDKRGSPRGNLPWAWRAWGARPVDWLLLPPRDFGDAERQRIGDLFPEAQVAPLSTPPRGERP